MSRTSLLKALRVTHLYFGLFISPAILFFALTGALQTVGLHETNRDHPEYHPAKWIVVLAQLHKKQVTALPVRRPQPPAALASSASAAPDAGPAPESGQGHRKHGEDASQEVGPAAGTMPRAPTQSAPAPPAGRKHNPVPLRLFFLIVCVGLFISTFTGIYMSYKFNRNRLWVTINLIAGVVVPLLLLIP